MLTRLRRLSLRSRITLVIVLALVLGGAPAAWAYWTSTQAANNTQTFTVGHLDLQLSGTQSGTLVFADNVTDYTPFDTAAMYPGATYAALLTVRNNGSIPLSYWLSVQDTHASPNLAGSLTTIARAAGTVSGTAPSTTCGGGTSLAAAQTVTATDTTFNAMGTAAAQRRQLAPGATESICVELDMLTSAPSSAQGQTSTVVYTAHAEQVAQP